MSPHGMTDLELTQWIMVEYSDRLHGLTDAFSVYEIRRIALMLTGRDLAREEAAA